MLKELRISNLILISSATIHFDSGFNVLSGETGAGKSAVMKALYLLAGDKTDTSIIRHGTDKATIEGIFDIDNIPGIGTLLEQSNIDHSSGEELIIRREVSLSGKGRCLINNQTTQLALLKKIGSHLLEMVGQHANQKLLMLEQHRHTIDLYGDHLEEAAAFAKSWERESKLARELDALIKSEAQRLREIEVCRLELEELHEANLKEDEEEELFAEYSRLANADEITTKIYEVTSSLNGEKVSVLALLKRQAVALEQLAKLDPSAEEVVQSHKNALMELQEAAYTLEKLGSRIEHNPERLNTINDRLALINKLKRKYGESVAAIQAYKGETEQKLQNLESADVMIEDGKVELQQLVEKNNKLASELTAKRQKTAKKLAKGLTDQLRALNMPKVEFEIDVTRQQRSAHGDDQVEFFLTPNVGERRIPIREHASGGELSRILLALQTLLAGKESVAALVFDEIDANIGGATAVVIGEKLRDIGRQHQVLCITHFPQVAKQADHHIRIEKEEEAGRTFSRIERLDAKGRQSELDRMAGIVS